MKIVILTLVVIQLVIIGWFWRFLPPQVPLFFSRPWGEDQLVAPVYLFLIPGLGAGSLLVNFVLNYLVSKEEGLLRRVADYSSFILALFCLVALIQIFRLII